MAKLSDIGNIVARALADESILEAGTKGLKGTIQKRTRLGKGVRENLGPNHPLPKLRETTKKIRRNLESQGLLTGPDAKPGKSGLNRTGELLNSIEVNVSKGEINVTLPPDEQRKLDEVLMISEDYQFMRLSRAEFKQVLEKIQNKLNSILSKINITDL